jgi:hypothetical protein
MPLDLSARSPLYPTASKQFAAQALPTLHEHLRMAEDIQRAVTGQYS